MQMKKVGPEKAKFKFWIQDQVGTYNSVTMVLI